MTAVAVRLLCLIINGHLAHRNVRPLLTMHFTVEKKCTMTRIKNQQQILLDVVAKGGNKEKQSSKIASSARTPQLEASY